VVPLADAYVRWMIPGIPAFLGFVVVRQSLQALHRVRPIVLAIVAGNLANVFLDWGFIHGRAGLPELGAVGCAVATSLVRWLMLAALVWMAWPLLRPYLRPLRREALKRQPLLRMATLGAPIGAQMLLEMGAFSFVALAMGVIGETELAGHQVALNLAALSFMVPVGISAAAAVRVGHAVGRGDLGGLRRASGVAVVTGAGVMVLFALLFLLLPRALARLYTPDVSVIDVAAVLLPIAAAFQVFDGLQVVCSGVLRGAGDTRTPPLVYLLGFWLLGIPAALLLAFSLEQGPRGLWIGLAIALAAVAVVLLMRVRWRAAQLPRRVDLDEAASATQG
jgi:MATE family multidrug resistance protein